VILMPRLSDTMTEGVIADWHKKVGDSVKKGDILADIETDKATMELESYKEGKLLYTGAQKGDKIAVNELLAVIGDESKLDLQKIIAVSKNKAVTGPQAVASPVTGTAGTTGQAPAAASAPATPVAGPTPSVNGDGRIKASPLAKKIAADKGIDISQVPGSGDGGRIVKKDVDDFVPAKTSAAAATGTTTAAGSAGELYRNTRIANAEGDRQTAVGKPFHGPAFLPYHEYRHG
jgi:pyruvate dehydrogenase E2 component (dihydrolipoamide acetyltransferase)